MATIPKRVADRLAKHVRVFQRVLHDAKDRDVNESDTVKIVTDILAYVFGFDKWKEITSEYVIKGTYCDLATKVGNEIQYLIEVKAIGLTLKENHLHQAVNYAVQNGTDWTVLTNGIFWEVYRIQFERPVRWQLVTKFNFLEVDPRKQDDRELLYLLCKRGIKSGATKEHYEQVQVVNRFMIGATILSDPVLQAIRLGLRRVSPKVKIELCDVRTVLENDVLKRELVEGEMATKAKGRVKRAAKTKLK
jgi:hypothetical protein